MMLLGTQLHPDDIVHVLAAYVHRFTGNHRPNWAKATMPNGKPYKVQFKDDNDWLAHTRFVCRKDGRIDHRARFSESSPTWPAI